MQPAASQYRPLARARSRGNGHRGERPTHVTIEIIRRMGTRLAGRDRWPVAGHAPAFLRDKLGLLERVDRQDGPVAEVRLGPRRALLLCDPTDIKHVLVTNARNYEKTPRLTSDAGRSMLGRGLMTITGDGHRRQRL